MKTIQTRSWLLSVAVMLVSSAASANIVGVDTQNFNPTTDGLDFVTVQSSDTLQPGILNTGVFFNFATNSLPVRGIQSPDYSDRLWSSDIGVGFGIIHGWDFGISIPAILSQSVSNGTGPGAQYASTGVTEIKLNTKVRLYKDEKQGVATILSTGFGLIENDAFTGNPSHPGLNLEFAYTRGFGPVTWGLNFGHRWRVPGNSIPGSGIAPTRNQWIASTAASYLVESIDTKFIAEIFGAVPVSHTDSPDDDQQTSFEGLLGLKYDFTTHITANTGVGRSLIHGVASPDFRYYVGVNVAIGPFGHQVGLEKPEPAEAPQALRIDEELTIAKLRDIEVAKEDRFIARNMHFAFNSTELEGGQENQDTLNELVEYLKKAPYRKLVVEGHTDSVGKDSYNQSLSELRAQAIVNELVAHHGIPATKSVGIGFGKTRPIADNGNYQGRLMNRRVEFKIVR
jgi:outer membrane protein OmpA-like peptidoglycan-associated protein